MSTKVEKALELHDKGYNCAQAVACSFCEEFGVDQETMFKISEGFGFGMGMMDMCGAVTGMMMVIGMDNSIGNLENNQVLTLIGADDASLSTWCVLNGAKNTSTITKIKYIGFFDFKNYSAIMSNIIN